MRQLDSLPRSPGVGFEVEHERVARRDLDLALGEGSDPELRSLQIGKDADRPADFLLDFANDSRRAS